MEVQDTIDNLKNSDEFKKSYNEINNLLPPVIEEDASGDWLAEVGPNICFAKEVKGHFDKESLELGNDFADSTDNIQELKAKYQSKLDYLEFFNQKLVNGQIDLDKRANEITKAEALSEARANELDLRMEDLDIKEQELAQALALFEDNKEKLQTDFREHLVAVEKHRLIEQENLKKSHLLKKFRIELKTKAENLNEVRVKLNASKAELEEFNTELSKKESDLEKREQTLKAQGLDIKRREEALNKNISLLKEHKDKIKTNQEQFVNSIYATLLEQIDKQEGAAARSIENNATL